MQSPTKPASAFDENTIKLIVQTRDLLDELLETLDILSSPESLQKIERAEKEVEEGKVKSFDAFLAEYRDKSELLHQSHKTVRERLQALDKTNEILKPIDTFSAPGSV